MHSKNTIITDTFGHPVNYVKSDFCQQSIHKKKETYMNFMLHSAFCEVVIFYFILNTYQKENRPI